MKIMQMLEALPSLRKLAAQDLSIKVLYRVSKLMGKLDEEFAFYDKQRSKILAQYCDIVGNQYVPRQENEEELNKAMSELLDIDIECDVTEVVLSYNEDVKLSYNDLVALKNFVRIGDE